MSNLLSRLGQVPGRSRVAGTTYFSRFPLRIREIGLSGFQGLARAVWTYGCPSRPGQRGDLGVTKGPALSAQDLDGFGFWGRLMVPTDVSHRSRSSRHVN